MMAEMNVICLFSFLLVILAPYFNWSISNLGFILLAIRSTAKFSPEPWLCFFLINLDPCKDLYDVLLDMGKISRNLLCR